MEKENKQQHEGLTIIIRRDLNEVEKENLKEIIDHYIHEDDTTTIGFF